MPTPVAHSLAGAAIALASSKKGSLSWPLILSSAVAACFADIDFLLGFLAGRNLHHYFTHSVGFTIFFATAILLATRSRRLTAVLGVSYLSHVLLDMLSKDTSPPYGVQLFWPFSDAFYISPVLVFDDIWRGTLAKLFGLHNWLAVARELLIVGPFAVLAFFRRRRQPE